MSHIEAASADAVQEGTIFTATLAGRPVAITRVDGTVQAFINKCPHLGLKLTKGKIENGIITCPFHGSSFNICTGRDTQWAHAFLGIPLPHFLHGLLAMGKPPHGLTKLEASEADGKIYVTL